MPAITKGEGSEIIPDDFNEIEQIGGGFFSAVGNW